MKIIRGFFVVAGVYEALLGLVFLIQPERVFAFFGVTPPNHNAYVQFPALLLLLFAALFFQVARDPQRGRILIPYGMGLKVAYCGTVFGYALTKGIPSMWVPWAWADLVFLVVFGLIYMRLQKDQKPCP